MRIPFEKINLTGAFSKTPDGQGYYTFKNKYYSACFEVLPFEKVPKDAKRRNMILFYKLGLNTHKNNLLFNSDHPLAVRHITQKLVFVLLRNFSVCVKSLPAHTCHSARQVAKAENFVSP